MEESWRAERVKDEERGRRGETKERSKWTGVSEVVETTGRLPEGGRCCCDYILGVTFEGGRQDDGCQSERLQLHMPSKRAATAEAYVRLHLLWSQRMPCRCSCRSRCGPSGAMLGSNFRGANSCQRTRMPSECIEEAISPDHPNVSEWVWQANEKLLKLRPVSDPKRPEVERGAEKGREEWGLIGRSGADGVEAKCSCCMHARTQKRADSLQLKLNCTELHRPRRRESRLKAPAAPCHIDQSLVSFGSSPPPSPKAAFGHSEVGGLHR